MTVTDIETRATKCKRILQHVPLKLWLHGTVGSWHGSLFYGYFFCSV